MWGQNSNEDDGRRREQYFGAEEYSFVIWERV